MTPTQRPTFSWRVIGGGGGFSYLLASGGASGSINFDFTTGSLPAGITFTRASIGTYNSSGNLLVTAGNDVARFNYVSGVANLLIEGSATNILTQSNNFSAADWVVSTATATGAQFISPDGTNNGWAMTSTAANGYIYELATYSNAPYTLSLWVKLITAGSFIQLTLGGVGSGGGVVATTTLARLPFTAIAAAGSAATILQNIGTVGALGIYGCQLETGSKMTSYIPTTTAAVTRAADSAVFTIPTGINQLVYTFDDNSTQTVAVSPGSYTIPTTLNRPNIKSVVGRYAFDFTSGSLPAGMTFTRPSIGTYTNVSGTLITAGNDVARFNYISGVANLLIEGAATNLALQSNALGTSPWSPSGAATITANQFTSPDGSNNGWSIAAGAVNAGIYQLFNYANGPYVLSLWARYVVGTSGTILTVQGVSGAAIPHPSLTRIFFSRVATAQAGALIIWQIPISGSTNGYYGAQLETGSVPTSYIPTTTAAVTRSADSATFTIPAGVTSLTYTFDDNSTQVVSVAAGSYTIPTTLNRANIKSIVGSA
jgi:hypothetical protein